MEAVAAEGEQRRGLGDARQRAGPHRVRAVAPRADGALHQKCALFVVVVIVIVVVDVGVVVVVMRSKIGSIRCRMRSSAEVRDCVDDDAVHA